MAPVSFESLPLGKGHLPAAVTGNNTPQRNKKIVGLEFLEDLSSCSQKDTDIPPGFNLSFTLIPLSQRHLQFPRFLALEAASAGNQLRAKVSPEARAGLRSLEAKQTKSGSEGFILAGVVLVFLLSLSSLPFANPGMGISRKWVCLG